MRKQWILMNTLRRKSSKFRSDHETPERMLSIGQLFDGSIQTIVEDIRADTCFIRKKLKTDFKNFLPCTIDRQRCNSILKPRPCAQNDRCYCRRRRTWWRRSSSSTCGRKKDKKLISPFFVKAIVVESHVACAPRTNVTTRSKIKTTNRIRLFSIRSLRTVFHCLSVVAPLLYNSFTQKKKN